MTHNEQSQRETSATNAAGYYHAFWKQLLPHLGVSHKLVEIFPHFAIAYL